MANQSSNLGLRCMDSEDEDLLLARKDYESLRSSFVKVYVRASSVYASFSLNHTLCNDDVLFACAGSGWFQRGHSSRSR